MHILCLLFLFITGGVDATRHCRGLFGIVCTARTAVAFLTRTACTTDAVLKASMPRDFADISFCACAMPHFMHVLDACLTQLSTVKERGSRLHPVCLSTVAGH